ncbi:MAG: phosphoenolpyruvate--protein phosphotransferase [Hyphomicrobiaceae bacterium]
MPLSDAGPRILLRRLRQIMAEPGSGQERLDKIVRQIANLMVAEVCSIYIRRQDGSLELFATEGLNPAAVHNTHMARNEGLVGMIAENGETVNLPDARSHPSFSYRPETGEESYHSFLGVPVQRGGIVLGVLVVQNRTQRHYASDEEEALQTIAMVLAEHLASGDVQGVSGYAAARGRSPIVKGQPLSDGIALGHVVLHEPRVVVRNLFGDDLKLERRRLARAIRTLRQDIDRMLQRRDIAGPGEHRDVLDTYRMFARDSGWIGKMREAIEKGLTAEGAVERVRNDTRVRMMRHADAFWRERFRDLDDLSDRLLRHLAGREATAAGEALPEDTILVARTMGPAELLDYDRERLRGLVIEEGGLASHVAIVAKALGIPAIGQARRIIEAVEAGDAAIVDALEGEVHIRPTADVIAAYSDKVRFRARRQKRYAGLRTDPAVTRDGERVRLNINAGLTVDMPHLAQSGADGIGLFRTEIEFMIAPSLLLRDRQAAIYKRILDAAGGRPVVFRTLDIGGDKLLPYLAQEKEENPSLGWRALRMSLDSQALFRTQVRALIKAAAGRDLDFMLPMVTTIDEYDRARALIEADLDWSRGRGWPQPERVRIGAMLEVPSLLFDIDRLFARADFVSVGSNDLCQFIYASDRNNARLAGRYDTLGMPMMRALDLVAAAARRHDKPLALCGEMASRPLEALALIALGFRSISMAPASIGPVKAMVLSLDAGRATGLVRRLIDEPGERASLRDELAGFALDSGVEIDDMARPPRERRPA